MFSIFKFVIAAKVTDKAYCLIVVIWGSCDVRAYINVTTHDVIIKACVGFLCCAHIRLIAMQFIAYYQYVSHSGFITPH